MARSDEAQVTTVNFRLPQWMHEQLRRAGGDQGVSEEIRRRLEFTLKISDEQTEDLLTAIAELAAVLARENKWWQDSFVFEVLKEGVSFLLDMRKPSGEPPEPRTHAVIDEDTKPTGAARILAAIRKTRKEPGQ
jgi:hypothetical protein